ncbi:MAG: hypothetical protein WKF40_05770 [Thermoleophilaceae bacterium]
MKAAMAPLAVLAVIGGVLGIPGVTETLEHFMEPTFADSRFAETAPIDRRRDLGTGGGRGVGDHRHRRRLLRVHAQAGASRARTQERFAGVHSFLFHKWYFDELFDALFVRPGATLGRFGRTVVESSVRAGLPGGRHGGDRARRHLARALDPDR